ncbi:MAG TPA: FAD-binding protein [Polyangiaceae bacterium]|jgi:FAD/FMN-containing dehydrogenase|nr:FAD-binding protein [Polyangiaceae bacterium]
MDRRGFLRVGAGAGAFIIGFDRTANAWVTDAHHGGPFDHVPKLDGQLLTDQASRDARGRDLGNIIFNTPAAVLRPASIDDVAKMVKFCADRDIFVAARGQGHATHGQAQARAGLVIDMSTLGAVREIGPGYAVVDGGATWRLLLETALVDAGGPQTPPVLTGFIGLSIGGTLSMGGISGMAYDKGVQVEHVLELKVVTGKGDVIDCSPKKHRDLFDAVLAGVGQCGIIVRAKVEMVPAEERALAVTMRYNDVERFHADMRTLVLRGELDMVWGDARQDGSGWFYELMTTSFYTPPEAPDIAYLTRDLHYEPGTLVPADSTYLQYQTQVDNFVAFLRSMNLFDEVMHPWFDVFLPDSSFADYVGDTVSGFQPDDVGTFGFILFFPLLKSTITRPLFRLPNEPIVYLFDVLTQRDQPGYDADFAANKRARNNAWFELARDVGGTRYPIGTLDFTPEDWRRQYGPVWRNFETAKHKYDPDNVLAPGPNIFPKECD